jgi:hypothetical protein
MNNNMSLILWTAGCLVLLSTISFGQSRAKFEPPDGRVIHGLGQYTAIFYTDSENWQQVEEYQNAVKNMPVIYSVYTSIDPYIRRISSPDYNDIITNHQYPYLLVVGLTLHDSTTLITGTFNVHVESILNGSLDTQIREVANNLKAIESPVFLRPGFEFGSGNAGAHSDPDLNASDFKSIWLHLYNIFQEEGVGNIAWIWNTVNPQLFNYMEWYPGDEFVDWWGINYFTAGQISSGDNFLTAAAEHNKPIMICESSPIENNGTINASNWQNWFEPYFAKIDEYPNIKAFIYIHDPWDRGPFVSWPDSRITSNETIKSNYTMQLSDSIYVHIDEYLSNPGILEGNSNAMGEVINVATYHLSLKNYPNPFNISTKIKWQYTPSHTFYLDIYNVVGQKVDSFIVDRSVSGKYGVNWVAANKSSGIYFAVLTIRDSKYKGDTTDLDSQNILKMIFLK